MTPPEGFDSSLAPVARGKRDPELQFALQAEQLDEAGENTEATFVGLMEGDGIIAKVTLAGKTPVGDAWFTYGVQTRVADNESEAEAFARVADVVNTRVLDLAEDAIERIEIAQAEAAQQSRRITPRRN